MQKRTFLRAFFLRYAFMRFEAAVHGRAVLVPHLFDFARVVLIFKPTVISLLLAFMLVSACVALFVYIL